MLCYDCCVDIMYVVSDLGEWNDDNDDVIGQDETRQGAVSILFNVIELLFFFCNSLIGSTTHRRISFQKMHGW